MIPATSFLTARTDPADTSSRIIAFVLYGVSLAVSIRYFSSAESTEDPLWTRLHMLFMTIMNTIATAMLAVDTISTIAARGDGVYSATKVGVAYLLYYFAFIIVNLAAQMLLARRAYLLALQAAQGPKWFGTQKTIALVVLVGTLMLTMGVSAAGYLGVAVLIIQVFRDAASVPSMLERYGFTVAFSSSALTDVIISTALGWHWLHWLRKGDALSPKTHSLLRKLSAFTLATALFTTIPAVVFVITVAAAPHSSVYFLFSTPLPQLYTISLFTTMNVRKSLRKQHAFHPVPPTIPTPQPWSSAFESCGAPSRFLSSLPSQSRSEEECA